MAEIDPVDAAVTLEKLIEVLHGLSVIQTLLTDELNTVSERVTDIETTLAFLQKSLNV